ncbi:hypothetical protein [Nocardia callitridis]|uniref:Uncharacterized protein n=1 Tax=Nocardia callitridis TaxID=648753 RepID=A0ABP9KKT5_9NOCA
MSDEPVFTEWGYSEDERAIPYGFKSTEDAPEAERWARKRAAQYHSQGGRLFRRAVSPWVTVDESAGALTNGAQGRPIHMTQALRSATTHTWEIQPPAAIFSDRTEPDEQTSVAVYPDAADIDARVYAGAATPERATELLRETIARFEAQTISPAKVDMREPSR